MHVLVSVGVAVAVNVGDSVTVPLAVRVADADGDALNVAETELVVDIVFEALAVFDLDKLTLAETDADFVSTN